MEEPPQPASPFRDRNFVLLWLGQLISNLGDAALLIAVPVTLYDSTGSKGALSLWTIAAAVPTLLLGLFAGVFVDRWDRRRTMVASDIGRAVCVLLMLFAHGPRQTWVYYLATFLLAAFSCFFSPARAGVMKAILPGKRLMQGNALITSGMQITALLGPVLGGVLLSLIGAHGVFIFDSATFAASALCIFLLRTTAVPVKAPRAFAGVWRDMTAGLRYVGARPVLSGLMALLGIVLVGAEISNTLEYAFVKDIWHARSLFGYLMAAFGVGMIAGGLLTAGPLRDVEPKRLLVWAFAIFTVGGFGWACAPNFYWGVLALCVFGLGNMLINIPLATLFQTITSQDMIGRVTATAGVVNRVSMLIAGALAAGLMHLPLQPVFVGLALVYLAATLLVRPLLERNASHV